MDETLKQIVFHYHQAEIPSDQAAYFATETYVRFRQARAEAEQNNQTWLNILAEIAQTLPEYAVQDITNLADNACYEGELLLHENTSFLDDDLELLSQLNNRRLTLRLLVSVLGPFYYLFIEEQQYNPTTNEHSFTIIDPETTAQKQIVQQIKQTVEQYQYRFLERATLKQIIPELTTEFQGVGTVSVFHCLFSDLMNFY